MNGSIIYIYIYIYYTFIIKGDVSQMVENSKRFSERNEDRYLASPYFFHYYLPLMFFSPLLHASIFRYYCRFEKKN